MGRVAWLGSIVGVLAASLSCACAVTTSTCPLQTKLVGSTSTAGRAQWCEITDAATTGVPATSRTYEGRLEFVQPTAMPGGIEGPFTSWHPNGTLAAHGPYLNFGARSVPHGLWTFWYPSGQRRVLGLYRRGQPQGCFAAWDESGQRKTGMMEGDQLRVESCEPPGDDDVVSLERGAQRSTRSTTWADFHLQGMAGPNRIGAANPVQIAQDPGMTLAFSATARKHVSGFRLGPTAGARLGNESGYSALAIGGHVAWRLPALHPRIDTEIAAEMAAQRLSVSNPQRRMQPGISSAVAFWSPLPALQLTFAFAMSPSIEALVAARVDGLPARNVQREMRYCTNICFVPVQETWSIGGTAYGVVVGIRLLVR